MCVCVCGCGCVGVCVCVGGCVCSCVRMYIHRKRERNRFSNMRNNHSVIEILSGPMCHICVPVTEGSVELK